MNEKRKTDYWGVSRPPPRWNIISLLFPLVAGAASVFIGSHPLVGRASWVGEVGIFVAIGVSLLAGLTAGIIALCRRERFFGLTFVGICVNGFPIMWGTFGLLLVEGMR
jgi:hypothetical protein